MGNVSFIGLGSMAQAIATRAVAGGYTVELIGRDEAKAQGVATGLGSAAIVGKFGTIPSGDLVVLAVPYTSSVSVVTEYGDALAGKVIIDISNTFNATGSGLVAPDGTSGAQEIARAVPASAHVVKAFNTVFGHVLAKGHPLDVFVAGDDAGAKASASVFIERLGLRPLDVGGLEMARWLEGAGALMMGLARHGVGTFDVALGVNTFS